MAQHNRPNADRLRMIMDTNKVTVAEVASMLSVSQETVDDWLSPANQEGAQDIPDQMLKQLRMKLSVNR
jgi:transposase-like protein